MSPLLRNILAVIGGLIIGGIVNSGIIALGPNFISAPDGVNPNDIASMKENVNLYGAKHFIVPFLAHSLGTLAGAFIAVKAGATNLKSLSFIIAGLFFIGGAMMAYMLPEFWKFSIIDLVIAYFPMALLAWKLGGSNSSNI